MLVGSLLLSRVQRHQETATASSLAVVMAEGEDPMLAVPKNRVKCSSRTLLLCRTPSDRR